MPRPTPDPHPLPLPPEAHTQPPETRPQRKAPGKQVGDMRRDLLEIGGAETARARRYERALAVITLEVANADARSDDLALNVIEALIRTGADRALRLESGRFVAVLPETALSGAMHLASRLQHRLAACGVTARVGFAALVPGDTRFPEMLSRAQAMVEEI